MKSIRYILSLVVLALSQTLSAQRDLTAQEMVQSDSRFSIYEGVYIFEPVWFHHNFKSKETEVDRSQLRITYEASVVENPESGKKYKDRMIVLIGDNWYKSYGESTWKGIKWGSDPDSDLYGIEKGYEEALPHVVYRNLKSKTIINRGIFPELTGVIFRYDEAQPAFKWNISDEMKDIEGFLCQKATTEYKGREWTVWFTPEIPVDGGLWKFSGLPGLILEAHDAKEEYHFMLGSIEQKEEAIPWYNTDKEKKMSRSEFRKQEARIYDNPILYGKGPDGYKSIFSEQRNLDLYTLFTPGHFKYAYNPMELE